MVGGDQTAFDKVMPLFELMGQNITLVGSNGAGQTCKVANQIIVALTIEAVGEALLFASKAGADPAKVRQALMGGFASSKILEIHGERMIKRTFDPGFRITLHQKDLNLALSNARKLQMETPSWTTLPWSWPLRNWPNIKFADRSTVVLPWEGGNFVQNLILRSRLCERSASRVRN
jgi:2-hydroxy-3-oxopropionate reductase